MVGTAPICKPSTRLLAMMWTYATLVKVYGTSGEGQKRYSPAEIKGINKTC